MHVDLATGVIEDRTGAAGGRLSTRERALFAYLVDNPLRTIPRQELLREVWGYADQVVSRAADTTMRRLREKLEPSPDEPVHLLTEFGAGYRFVPHEVETEPSPVPQASVAPPLRMTACAVDLSRRTILRDDGSVLPVTANEVGILEALYARRGAVVSRTVLRRAIGVSSGRGLDAAMARLRAKIEHDPSTPDHLLTQRGEGYRLVVPEGDAPLVALVVCGWCEADRAWAADPVAMSTHTARALHALDERATAHP